MSKLKKKKLDLKIIQALAPSAMGIAVALIILGNQIGILVSSLVAGYIASLITKLLIEHIGKLKRRG